MVMSFRYNLPTGRLSWQIDLDNLSFSLESFQVSVNSGDSQPGNFILG